MKEINLKKTQELFWAFTQEPEGVAQALKKLQTNSQIGIGPLRDLLVEHRPGEALERMEAYAQMYFWRLFESLQEDYPTLEAVLGEDKFQSLIVDYLQTHPSRSRDLSLVGIHLPKFLQQHPFTQTQPYLPDLAALEWAKIAIHREVDPKPLDVKTLQKIPPGEWSEIYLKRISAAQLLVSPWNVYRLWKQVSLEEKPLTQVTPEQKTIRVLLWRKGYSWHAQPLEEIESQLLMKLERGIRFGELCKLLAGIDEATAPARAAQYLQDWIGRALLQQTDR